jgi:uncharacterized protein
MGHGFSATTEMVANRYAEVFCEGGVAALLYDHRGFGASGGEPRQQIDPWMQVVGYRDAIEFASGLRELDRSRVALWGDSMSAGCALVAAAFDPRVSALVGQVPALGRTPPPDDPDGALVEAMAGVYGRPELGSLAGQSEGPMPVVSSDQLTTPSALTPLTAFRWFIEYGGRYGSGWQNWITRVKRGSDEPYHPVLAASRVRCPTQLIIAIEDEMPGARSEIAHLAYDRLAGPKELIEIEGGHFGLLFHPSPLFDQASTAQRDFLRRHLGVA